MSLMVSCFKCGKHILVPLEKSRETAYCMSCRISLGLADPNDEAPPPKAPAKKPSRSDGSKHGRHITPKPDKAIEAFPVAAAAPDTPRTGRKRDSGSSTLLYVAAGVAGFGLLLVLLACVAVVGALALSDNLNNNLAGKSGGQGTAPPPVVVSSPPPPAFVPPPPPVGQPPAFPPPPPPPDKPGTEIPLVKSIAASPAGILHVAFNPDGKKVVSASGLLGRSGELRFWDATTGATEPVAYAPGSALYGVTFSKDANLMAVAAGTQGVQVFDKDLRPCGLFVHPLAVRGVAFSPDSKRLASCCGTMLKVWDLQAAGQLLWKDDLRTNVSLLSVPLRLTFSPDGKFVAAPDGAKDVAILDADTGKTRATCQGHTDNALCAAYSQDGKYLVSAGMDGTVRVWNPSNGAAIKTLEGHRNWVYCVAFAPDDRTVASAGRDGTVVLWDVPTGKKLATIAAHRAEASCVAFSRTGDRLATSGRDGKVQIWDVSKIVGAK